LPLQAGASCPAGTSAAPSGKCLWLTNETGAHHECSALCGTGHSLTCLSSDEDSAFATALLDQAAQASSAWFGAFQPLNSPEPQGGWACSSGESLSNVTSRGVTNDGRVPCIHSQENCAALQPGGNNAAHGSWQDAACLSDLRCLCEVDATTSADYLAFAEEMQAIQARSTSFAAGMPRLTSYNPTTYSLDVHAPGNAACPCLRESARFGTRVGASGGGFIEWDETYLMNKCETSPGVFTSCDYGRRYGLGCADHDNLKAGNSKWKCDASDPADRSGYCFEPWCYVDPDTCTAWSLSYPSIYKTGLRYSVMACDATSVGSLAHESTVQAYNTCVEDENLAISEATYAEDATQVFSVVLGLWVLPLLLLLAHLAVRRCCVACGAHPAQVLPNVSRGASALPSWRSQRSMPHFRDPSEAAAVQKLDAAERAAHALRLRAGAISIGLGWVLIVLAVTPNVMASVLEPDFNRNRWLGGTRTMYWLAFPWALGMLLLTVRPIDTVLIRLVGFLVFGVYLLLLYRSVDEIPAVIKRNPNFFSPIALAAAILSLVFNLVSAAALSPLLVTGRCGRKVPESWQMAPRLQLLRLWLVVRFTFLGYAVAYCGHWLSPIWPFGGSIVPKWRDVVYGGRDNFVTICLIANYTIAALVFSPANRGRFLYRLGRLLSTHGSKEQEAASVAALIGGRGAAATLAKACGRFRALPLASLTRAELADNKPDPAMHAKTVEATLGSVDAFASHSWSDDGNVKFDKLDEWAGEAPKRVWLDKVCTASAAAAAAAFPPTLCQRRVRKSLPACTQSEEQPLAAALRLRTHPHPCGGVSRRLVPRARRRASTRRTSPTRWRVCPSSSRDAAPCSASSAQRMRAGCGASWSLCADARGPLTRTCIPQPTLGPSVLCDASESRTERLRAPPLRLCVHVRVAVCLPTDGRQARGHPGAAARKGGRVAPAEGEPRQL
jgi:hypothetical protein